MRFFVFSASDGSGGREPLPGRGFSAAVVSDVGLLRPNNEDNYILGNRINDQSSDRSEAALDGPPEMWRIAGVFDGMGGGEMGEAASRTAVESFLRGSDPGPRSKTEIDAFIRDSFLNANNEILRLQKRSGIFGTTGTVICAGAEAFKIYHLGDSRAYLFRDGRLFQLTKDQTLAQMRLDAGIGPPSEADRHKLTNYIGRDRTGENLRPTESLWLPLLPGDLILLCTDGLYHVCPETVMVRILAAPGTPREKAGELTGAALSGGGQDNVTCMVLSFS